MVYTVLYDSKPDAVMYCLLKDGTADVWLRRNIRETETAADAGEDITAAAGRGWEAEEVYFRTSLTEEAVEQQFDHLYESEAAREPDASPDNEELRERALQAGEKMAELAEQIRWQGETISMLEECLMEMSELVYA